MSKTQPSKERFEDQCYLPGVSISAAPGPIGRFLTRLFRRRGRF